MEPQTKPRESQPEPLTPPGDANENLSSAPPHGLQIGQTVHFVTRNELRQTVERPAIPIRGHLDGVSHDPHRWDLWVFFSPTDDGRGPQEVVDVKYAHADAYALDTWHFAEEHA